MRHARKQTAKTEPRPSRTRAPGKDTGYSHPKCFAAALGDCVEELTREHYISKVVLDDLGGMFYVTRAARRWEDKPLSSDGLACKMLCKRHNGALSALDGTGRAFARCIRFAHERVAAGGGRDTLNGIDVERWLLKMLCGYTVLDRDPVPVEWLRLLFGYDEIRVPCGLHVNVAIGDAMGGADGRIEFATAYNAAHERVGCAFTLHGYRFLLGLDGKRVFDADELGKLSVLRPRQLTWTHATTRARYRLLIGWPWGTAGDGVNLTWTPPPPS